MGRIYARLWSNCLSFSWEIKREAYVRIWGVSNKSLNGAVKEDEIQQRIDWNEIQAG